MVDGSDYAGIPGWGSDSLSRQVAGGANASVKYSSRCDIGGGYDNRLSALSLQAATGKGCAMPALTDRGDRPEIGHCRHSTSKESQSAMRRLSASCVVALSERRRFASAR